MKSCFLIICTLLMVGCATVAGYERKLESWVGRSADELVRSWGYPDRQVTAPNGNAVYVYEYENTTTTTGYTTTYDKGDGRNETIYNPPLTYYHTCTTFFEIGPDRKVALWQWKGNYCVAPE